MSQAEPPWSEKRRMAAESTFAVASRALRHASELLEAGRYREAWEAVKASGVAFDKSGLLEIAAARAQERELRLADEQAQEVVRVIEDVIARDLELPFRRVRQGGGRRPPAR